MESGTSATIVLPKKDGGGFFGGGGTQPKKLAVWLTLETSTNHVKWATLQQQNGRPAEEGYIPVPDVLNARSAGVNVELSIRGQGGPTTLEFGTSAESSTWGQGLTLAVEVLTPE